MNKTKIIVMSAGCLIALAAGVQANQVNPVECAKYWAYAIGMGPDEDEKAIACSRFLSQRMDGAGQTGASQAVVVNTQGSQESAAALSRHQKGLLLADKDRGDKRAIQIARREVLMNAAREHRYKAKQQYKEAGGFLAAAGALGTLIAAGSFYPFIFSVVGLMVGVMAIFVSSYLLGQAIIQRDDISANNIAAAVIVATGAAVVSAFSFLFPWGIGALTLLVGAIAALGASGRSLNNALDNRRQAKNLEAEADVAIEA